MADYMGSGYIPTSFLKNRGSVRVFTFLECQIVMQVASLAIQYYTSGAYKPSLRSQIYFILSVTSLAILMTRYLSGYDNKSVKLGHVSTLLQFARLGVFQCLPIIVLPFLRQLSYPDTAKLLLLFAVASVLQMSALTQKRVGLTQAPNTLITDCHFRYLRSPDTLGTIGRYLTFPLLIPNTHLYLAALVINGMLIWAQLKHRDESLSKKAGFEEYAKKTNALVPKFFRPNILNYILLIAIVVGLAVPLKTL